MDHRQQIQNQEALDSVTNGLRDPSLSLHHEHQDLQLVRPSPHVAIIGVVGGAPSPSAAPDPAPPGCWPPVPGDQPSGLSCAAATREARTQGS